MSYTILQINLHHLDVKKQTIKEFKNVENETNFEKYVQNILIKIFDPKTNYRNFKIKSTSTQVINNLLSLTKNGNKHKLTKENAERLLEKEIAVQEKIDRLKMDVQKGSLIYIQLDFESQKNLVLCKVEFDEILTKNKLAKASGLNTKIKVYKAFMYNLVTDEIRIIDTNTSKYWWDDFLELKPVFTDDDNTKTSYQLIDDIIKNQNPKYHTDITTVRESLIGYYKTSSNFNFDEMMNRVFDNYEPDNLDFPIQKITERVKKLSKSKKFDTTFVINKKKVTKTTSKKIVVSSDIEIKITNAPINTLENHIVPVQEQGVKLLKVYTDKGYDEITKIISDNNIGNEGN